MNDERFIQRAEIVWEKGTNRSQFFRGQADKYTWVDIGSSYLPSEILAAFLWAQIEEVAAITERRVAIWNGYHQGLAELEKKGVFRRPIIPAECTNNAHMYYILTHDHDTQARLLESLADKGINAVFHYVPLHSSPAGKRFGRVHGELPATNTIAAGLLRLPIYADLKDVEVNYITEHITAFFGASIG